MVPRRKTFTAMLCLLPSIIFLCVFFSYRPTSTEDQRFSNPRGKTATKLTKVTFKPVLTAIEKLEGSALKVEEKQEIRLKKLNNFCALHPHLSGRQPGMDSEKLLRFHFGKHGKFYSVLPEYKFFECRVAKTGTTMRSFVWWAAFHGGKNIHEHPYYHPVEDDDVKKMDKMTLPELQKVIASFTGSIFVREPIMKIISAYFNKFCDPYRKELMKKKFNIINTIGTPSLGEILRKLASDEDLGIYKNDDHFTSYFDYCNPCLSNYSFIGRFENLKTDLNYLIYNKTQLHDGLSYSIDTAPVSPKRTECPYMMDHPDAFMDVNINDVKKLVEKLKFEYEAFGYDPADVIKYIEKRIKISQQGF